MAVSTGLVRLRRLRFKASKRIKISCAWRQFIPYGEDSVWIAVEYDGAFARGKIQLVLMAKIN